MATPWKIYQYQKQIQEKAKEAEEAKKSAKAKLDNCKEILENVKKIGGDGEIENLFREAEKAYERADYQRSNELCNSIEEKIKGIIEQYCTKTAELHAKIIKNLAETDELRSPDIPANLQGVKDLLTKAQLAEAARKVKEIDENFERLLREIFAKLFSIGEKLIAQSLSMGENIVYPQNLFSQAKKLFEEKNFGEAILKLNESLDILSLGVKTKVSETLTSLRNSIESASAIGMDVSEFLPLLEKAEKELRAYRFEEANALAEHLKARIGEKLGKAGESILISVKKFIERAEKIASQEEDFIKAKEIAEKIEGLLKKGDLKNASELAKQVKELSENAMFQIVLKTIASSRSKFITAKKIGADISQPLALINSARAALKNAEYENALKYALDADAEVEKIIKEYESSAIEIENLEASLNSLATFGIEIEEPRRLIEEARKELEAKNYKKVHEIVENAKNLAENAAYDRVLEFVEALTADLEYAKSIGCDVKKYEARHDEILAMVKARKVLDSIQNLRILREDISTAIQDFVIDTLAQVKDLIEKSVGVDTTFARQKIVEAENALQQGDIKGAYKLAEEARKSIKEYFSVQAARAIEDIGNVLASLQNLGMDVSLGMELYAKAKESYEKGDYPKALSYVDEIRSKLNRLLITKTEEEFTAAKLSLIEAKRAGIDITNLKNMLMEAKTAIEGGNYFRGYELAFKCHNEAERLKKLSQQAFDEISSAANMVAEAKRQNADITKVKDLLLKAKTAFENNDYETALQYARMTKEEASMLTAQYQAAKIILDVGEKISMADQLGIATLKPREMLEEAKNYMKSKDYKRSLEIAKACDEQISNLLNEHLSAKISEIENLIRNAKDLNVQVPKAEELIREARISFEKKDYINAFRYANESKQELERVVLASQNAAMEIKKAHEKINEAESLRIDVSASKTLLTQAMNALKTSNYKMAQELAAKCIADTDAAIVRHIEKLINSFQNVITNAKRSGAITVIAENMLAQARIALSQKNYKEALNLAMRSEGELERAELQYSMSSSAIANAQSKIEEAKRSGIVIPQNIEETLKNAKAALARGDYIKAMELAMATSDMVAEVKEKMREITEVIGLARNRITEAYKYGAELTEAKEIFAQAKAALESGKYAEALQLAKRCIEEAKNSFRNFLTSQLASIEQLVAIGNELKLDTTRLSALITQAKSAIETGEFEKVPEFINKAREYGEKMISDSFQRLLSQLQRMIEQAAPLMDVTPYSQLIEKCKARIGERAYEVAYKDLNNAIEKIQAEFHKALSEKISLFETQILSAEKVGIDTTASMEALTQAKIALNSKAYDGLNTFLENAMKELYENVKTKLTTVLYQIEVKLNYAKNMGVLLTDAEALLKKAKEAYANGNMGEAITNIQQCDVAIETAKDLHRELTDLLYTADSAIANARKYGLDTKESEEVLKEALYEKTRDYRKAIELTRKSIEIAKKIVEKYEEEMRAAEEKKREEEKRAEKKPKIIGAEKAEAEAKAEAQEVKEFEKGVATGNERCNFCKGKIKAGLPIIKCKCGAVYHEPCAKRLGKCSCGVSFEEKAVAKKLPVLKV